MIAQPVEEIEDDGQEKKEASSETPKFTPGHPLPPSLRAHDPKRTIPILPSKSANGEERRFNKSTDKESPFSLYGATRVLNVSHFLS